MKLRSRHSLKRQIHVIFAITVVLVFCAFFAFYIAAFYSLQAKEERHMFSMMSQVAQKTEDITTSVHLLTNSVCSAPAANSLLRETDANKKWSYRQALNTQTSDMARSNSSIANIVLLDNNGRVYGFNGLNYSLVNELNSKYDLFSPSVKIEGFIGPLYSKEGSIPYYANIKSIYDNRTTVPPNTKIGTCIVIGTCQPLYDTCLKAASSGNSLYMILNKKNQVIVRNLQENTNNEKAVIDAMQMHDEPVFSDKINNENYLISWKPLGGLTGWSVVSAVPYREITAGLASFHLLALLFFLLLAGTYFLLGRRVIIGITAPLEKIVAFVNKGPYYSLKNHVVLAEENELGELSDHINRMLDQINELTHTALNNQARLYETEIANSQARLSALQSQVNPHFLYNTLDAIRGLAYLKQTEDITVAVSALSAIMRYSIKGDEMVQVSQELVFVRKYLQIIDLRFKNRFEFNIDIPQEILDFQMPRFLLQPLVENAVFHGLEPKAGNGRLCLSAERQGETLRFTCVDDGVGICADELASLNKQLCDTAMQNNHAVPEGRQGIGLNNIHLRLRLIYGEPYGLTIQSKQGGGTTICMEFPAAPINKINIE